jgi:hypothetical protein
MELQNAGEKKSLATFSNLALALIKNNIRAIHPK